MVMVAAVATNVVGSGARADENTGNAKGFAVYQVDAEVGVHPDRPSASDQKMLSDEGHAYWVRSTPVLKGGLVEVGMDDSGRRLWLRVNEDAAKRFGEFTGANIGRQVAMVVDGRIVGGPAQVMAAIRGAQWVQAESPPLVAYVRCLTFERVQDSPKPSHKASGCRLVR
jgi:preprotein translocase subunit SecD